MPYIHPDRAYVFKTLEQLKYLNDGAQRKMAEIEDLRYMEDKVQLQNGERITGVEVKIGLTAEVIENVKAALVANPPRAAFKPHREGESAQANASNREKFWNAFFKWLNSPTPVISEGADAAVGLGYGIWKCAKYSWPQAGRTRKRGESAADFIKRLKPWKKKWGPPMRMITVHPLSFFFAPGIGGRIEECIEHSYKSRIGVMAQYGQRMRTDPMNSEDAEITAMLSGQSDQFVRALPNGVDTSTMALVTEYYNPDWYQVYVDGQLVYEEAKPSVCYFVVVGKTSSSKDPDKFGISIAENLRHNEPVLNRMLTRMAEAGELIVKKRLTVELPEGSTDDEVVDDEGNRSTRTFDFRGDVVEALPPGAKVVDPFTGVENIYGALPMLQLLMQITSQHGVSPIFKGMPPGASGSGYRDNSLYMMARSQFSYIVDSIQDSLAQIIEWFEELLVNHIKQTIYVDDYELSPADVADWPATITVELKPELPQNFIAEGEFWSRMQQTKMATKARAMEKGLGIEQPDEEETDIMFEEMAEALKAILYQDVIGSVLGKGPMASRTAGADAVTQGAEPANPMGASAGPNPPGGANQIFTSRSGGQESGGFATAGQAHAPAIQPGATVAG